MKGICILAGLACGLLTAQENTEVFLVEMNQNDRKINFAAAENISQNPDYDNQPSFYNDRTLLYSRTVDSLTEIAAYHLDEKSFRIVNQKNDAMEYSPQHMPSSENIVSVREKEGEQRLTVFDFETGLMLDKIYDRQIGYFAFYDKKNAIATILNGNSMHLYAIDFEKKQDTLLLKNVGRSVHKTPRDGMMSYSLPNEEQNYDVYLLDMQTLESIYVCELPVGVQDYAWLDRDQILIGSRNQLFVYDTFGKQEWEQIAQFEDQKIEKITRIAVSPDGKHLAFAAIIATEAP
ncbi:MAG: hypothetical protein WBG71_14170 [Leeuwenhoekiella sp.]